MIKAQPFNLKQVRLLDGIFKDNMQRDQNYLLQLEPDRFLHSFRVTAGLPSEAEPYGGWEAPEGELRVNRLEEELVARAGVNGRRGLAGSLGLQSSVDGADDEVEARGEAIAPDIFEQRLRFENQLLRR